MVDYLVCSGENHIVSLLVMLTNPLATSFAADIDRVGLLTEGIFVHVLSVLVHSMWATQASINWTTYVWVSVKRILTSLVLTKFLSSLDHELGFRSIYVGIS